MADTGKRNPPDKTEPQPKSPQQVRMLNVLRRPPPIPKRMQRKIEEEQRRFELRTKGVEGSDLSESEDSDEVVPELSGRMGRRVQHEQERFERRTAHTGDGSGPKTGGTDVPLRPPPRPRRAAPKMSPPSNLSTLKADFSPEKLEQLRKDVNRGGLKGVGDFGKLLDLGKKLHDKKIDAPEKELLVVEALIKACKKYLDERPGPDDGTPRQYKDAIEKRKLESAQAMLLEARRRQQDLLNAKFGPGLLSSDKVVQEKASLEHALAMAENYGATKPDGGTSDVILIKDVRGQVGYAFKSIEGETSQSKMPKGSGAVRESMASTFSDSIREQVGLDFGFPRVTLVEINGGKGALVEGLPGKAPNTENFMSFETREELTRHNQQMSDRAQRLPAKQLQKMLLCNLSMAQFDIKWDNLMLDDSSGEMLARPFDAGAAFLPKEEIQKSIIERGAQPGANLLMDPGNKQNLLPAAREPMDPELVDQFLSIDVEALERNLQREQRRMVQAHGLSPDLLSDDDADASIRSIRVIQRLLRNNPALTMEEFVVAYAGELNQLVA